MEVKRNISSVKPLEKALIYSIYKYGRDDENDVRKCLEELDKAKEVLPNSTLYF